MVRTLRYLFVFLLVIVAGKSYAQTGEITGTVVDDKKEPVVGAVIQVESGGINKGGTVTNIDGKYTIKPLAPGRYDLIAQYTGMTKTRIAGVVIASSGGITIQDIAMSSNTTLSEVVIAYKPPLIDKGKPGVDTRLTSEQIKNLPTHSTGDMAALATGVYQKKSGSSDLNIGGARNTGTLYIIDGVQVSGSRAVNLPPGSIDQAEIKTSGLSAKYGDATGGVVSLTTRGVSKDYKGGIVVEHSLDGFNNNLASFNISGPFASRKVNGIKRPIVGFFLTGEYRYEKDADPNYNKNPVLNKDTLANLQQHPLVATESPTGQPSLKPASEFVTKNAFVYQKQRINATSKQFDALGKLDFEITPGTNLTVGASFNYQNTFLYDRNYSLFAPDAMPTQKNYTGRAYLRFTQRFGKPATSAAGEEKYNTIQNAFYSVQVDYQKDYQGDQDPVHKHNTFDYGYVGKFTEHLAPVYQPNLDTGIKKTGIVLAGYQPTGPVTFERSDLNPVIANYTSEYYRLGGTLPTLMSNIATSGTYLRNGDAPNQTYSLWNNIGAYRTAYRDFNSDQFSIGVDASFDYNMQHSKHAIEFGLYYQQRTERFYGVSASGIWSLMRQLTHRVVGSELDLGNGHYIVNGKSYTMEEINNGVPFGPYDTILYDRKYNASAAPVGGFDYNLRKKLGLNPTGHDYLQTDMYDPSTYSLDMFTADELLNQGNGYVTYYGYDYTGKLQNGQVNFNDYWTKKDANGNFTRPIGAYRPNFIAGYISDNIRFKDIIFTIGVRLERFDNNTKVLKDPYSLYAERDVSQASGALNTLNGGVHPSNMGSNYVVYVNSNAGSAPSIIGYRNGDTWYDPFGKEVSDPGSLRVYSGKDPEPYLQTIAGDNNNQFTPKISDSLYDPNSSFTDYKPKINAMPRVSFSFPISDVALFYAHYDVIYQRPRPGVSASGALSGVGASATPTDYYFLTQNSNQVIGNPDLKPERAVNYEVGFSQKLSDVSAVTINAFYKERKDQIQVRPYIYAYPITYYTYGNRDFSTTKGLGLKYDLRRTNNLAMTISYTLNFAEGTGSSATSGYNGGNGLLGELVSAQIPNTIFSNSLDYDSRHIISVNADYRYADGEGPEIFGKHILQNAGINFLFTTRSGEPYSRLAQPQTIQSGVNNPNLILGGINGSRLPWHYILNTKLNKEFSLDMTKKKEDGSIKGRKYGFNVYVYIQNLLNTKDIITVYRYTGQPNNDGYLTSPTGSSVSATQTNPTSFADLYNTKMLVPTYYNNPRRIMFGLEFNF